MDSESIPPNVKEAASSAFSADFPNCILPDGEQISDEASDLVKSLGEDWLSSLTIEAASAAARRGSPTVEPEDVEYAFQILFGGDKALNGLSIPTKEIRPTTTPSREHLSRMEMLEKFRESQ